YTLVDNLPQGPAKTWYPDGTIRSIDHFRNGQLHGEIKRYLENGNYFSVNEFVDGKMQGRNRWYFPDGTLKSDSIYENNVRHGLAKFYYEDGTFKEEAMYAAGVPNGPSKYYHPNGQLAETRTFKNGKFDGMHTYYREDGTLHSKQTKVNGKKNGLCEYFYSDGQLEMAGTYVDGLSEGKLTWYYQGGDVKTMAYKKGGKLEGEYRSYWMEGSLSSVEHYVDDKLQGTRVEYFDFTDKVRARKHYDKGELNGPYQLYNLNGDLLIDAVVDYGRGTSVKAVHINEDVIASSLDDWDRIGTFGSIVQVLFHGRRFAELEMLANYIYTHPEYRPRLYPRIYSYMGASFWTINVKTHKEYFLDTIDAWEQAYPDSVTPKLLRAKIQIKVAWGFRGSDYSRSVSAASAARFKKALQEADNMIEKLVAEYPENPHIYTEWLSVLLGLGGKKSEMRAVF
ncbi:MAG: toxin-antitoxin system YwqK family antitoxin, partial [Candidatus Omnitrophica bacterium]|nr:toxin-antitoxin system YwqK family antitoxin [Candidatus Omnitrophota bacterium]